MRFLIFFPFLVLFGCSFNYAPQLPDGYSVGPDKALMFFSTRTAEDCQLQGGFRIDMRRKDIESFTENFYWEVFFANTHLPSHFNTEWGYVHAMEVDPGIYYFDDINTAYVGIELTEKPFEVSSGESVYLGAFRLEFSEPCNDQAWSLNEFDAFEQDSKILEQKVNGITLNNFRKIDVGNLD